MISSVDHVVLIVEDLERAQVEFETLGFEVQRGGEHPAWGTHNAIIALADGSYLELLAPVDPSIPPQHHLWSPRQGYRKPRDFAGYALRSDNLWEDVRRARACGIKYRDPRGGSRRRPDGGLVKWRSAFPERPDLPFLLQDETPRALRALPPQHGLGTSARLAEVKILVDDVFHSARLLECLLRVDAKRPASGRSSNPQIFLSGTKLTLVDTLTLPGPGSPESMLPGITSIALKVRMWPQTLSVLKPYLRRVSGEAGWVLDQAMTGGPRILLVPAP